MFSSSYISIDADPNHLDHCYILEHLHPDIIHNWLGWAAAFLVVYYMYFKFFSLKVTDCILLAPLTD